MIVMVKVMMTAPTTTNNRTTNNNRLGVAATFMSHKTTGNLPECFGITAIAQCWPTRTEYTRR